MERLKEELLGLEEERAKLTKDSEKPVYEPKSKFIKYLKGLTPNHHDYWVDRMRESLQEANDPKLQFTFRKAYSDWKDYEELDAYFLSMPQSDARYILARPFEFPPAVYQFMKEYYNRKEPEEVHKRKEFDKRFKQEQRERIYLER